MNSAVVTGFSGEEFRDYHGVTGPLIEKFAIANGRFSETVDLTGERPASWNKIPAIIRLLSKHDACLWIDADVVVRPDAVFPFTELEKSGCWQAMVIHHTPSGEVPNCGVWWVSKAMKETLQELWDEKRNIDHVWWEQASIIERMGYTTDHLGGCHRKEETELWTKTRVLEKRWNWHVHDCFSTDVPEFIHCTQPQNGDRHEWIRQTAKGVS